MKKSLAFLVAVILLLSAALTSCDFGDIFGTLIAEPKEEESNSEYKESKTLDEQGTPDETNTTDKPTTPDNPSNSDESDMPDEPTMPDEPSHTHAFTLKAIDEEYICSMATCTSKATYFYSCSCGENGTSIFEYGEKLAHTYDREVIAEKYLESAATCTEKALYQYSCKCGDEGISTFEFGETLGHDYEWIIDTPADKQNTGLKHEECTTCHTKQNEGTVIDMVYCNHETAQKTEQVNADHHNTGKKAYWYCSECNRYFSDENCQLEIENIDTYGIIAKIEHKFAAPWEKDANEHWHGCDCGDKTDVAEHVYNQKVVNDAYKKSDATYTEKSQYYYSCVCGKTGTETFEYEYLYTEGLEFVQTRDGYKVSNYNGTATMVYIPKEYNGKAVVKIGSYAFRGCTSLESVTIPNGVTSIGDYAFRGCTSLESITIPNSVTSVDNSVFLDCTSLKNVTIGNSVESIGSSAFYGCTALTKINFNATAMNDLSEYNKIFSYAGQSGTGITVNIGANVTQIPACLFCPYSDGSYAPKITSAGFAENSQCKSIGDFAFEYCTSLKNITIPDSVTSIGGWAFSSCDSLTSIQIPDSVTSIGSSAFSGCTSLAYN